MGTVHKFGAAKLLDTANAQLQGQARVNAEIFTAMELLGRKLERSEAERDRLSRRLSEIESAASIDEVTGKIYLPAVIAPPVQETVSTPVAVPVWMRAGTVLSLVMACVAVMAVMLRSPGLSSEQLALLESVRAPVVAASPVDGETVETAAVIENDDTAVTETVAAEIETATVVEMMPDQNLPAELAALEQRALQGIPEAQHDLAALYASGDGVVQDYTRARQWFEKSASRGIANADYNLGVMYQQGMGVDVDMSAALGYYENAAKQGHPEALYNLGIAYIQGISTEMDIDRGVAYFKRAANAGVAQAAYNLGILYEGGFVGGKADMGRALEWYEVASREGHVQAQKAAERLTSSTAARSLNAATSAN